ncbi:MAG: SWIM zinc finger family protein [Candidatus Micrarchaeota archaeon]|nr:SWIM zinc finger family protein [Candidatus Micrarchaeota archaeon]
MVRKHSDNRNRHNYCTCRKHYVCKHRGWAKYIYSATQQ